MNLIFFDIDGTLLPAGEKVIPLETKKVIEELQKDKNNQVFICTGRCYMQAKEFIDDLKLTNYITSNGQEVCLNDKIIYKSLFPKEKIMELIKISEENKIVWGFETRNNINLVDSKNGLFVKEVLEGYGIVNIGFSNNLEQEIYQFWLFGKPENIAIMETLLCEEFTVYRWSDSSIEVLPKNENKANGIKQVVKMFGENNITYGFGDGSNDLEMLKYVDKSVAMGNALEEVKLAAKYQTTECTKNGIRNGLKMVGLLKGE